MKKPYKNKLKPEDYEKIFDRYLTLMKQTEIAKEFRVSAERVRQVIESFTTRKEREVFGKLKEKLYNEKKKARNRERYQKKKKKMQKIHRKYYYEKSGGRPRSDMWTAKEDEILDKYYPISSWGVMLKKLKRSKNSIICRASMRGLKKTYSL